jgi:dolichyl-phosphate beta-glucosyltransferase
VSSPAIDLSIILPAYMEAGTIAGSLDRLAAFLATRQYGAVEVLVVVADSSDGTAKIAESRAKLFEHFRVVKAGPRAGKGRDVRLGVYEARGRYRLFMDADLATPLGHLDDVKRLMASNAKVGIAVRDLVKIHKGLLRKFMSSFGNIVAQIVLLPGIKDTQCGFKVFEAEAAEAIFSRQTMLGWSFDAEILKITRLLGYRIETIEAPDWKDPKAAGQGLVGDSPLGAAVRTFRDLFVVRLNVIRGVYKKPNYTHKPMYH